MPRKTQPHTNHEFLNKKEVLRYSWLAFLYLVLVWLFFWWIRIECGGFCWKMLGHTGEDVKDSWKMWRTFLGDVEGISLPQIQKQDGNVIQLKGKAQFSFPTGWIAIQIEEEGWYGRFFNSQSLYSAPKLFCWGGWRRLWCSQDDAAHSTISTNDNRSKLPFLVAQGTDPYPRHSKASCLLCCCCCCIGIQLASSDFKLFDSQITSPPTKTK